MKIFQPRLLRQILITSLLIFSVMGVSTSQAKTCEENFLDGTPGGKVPTTNTSVASNCFALHSKSGNAIKCYTCCGFYEWYTTQWCANNQYTKSVGSGQIRIYARVSHGRINVRGGGSYNFSGDLNDINSGLSINAGNDFSVQVGEYKLDDGPGWRDAKDSNSWFISAETDAINKGYVVIAQQTWSDALTASIYDTYDFDDLSVLIAVKSLLPPPPPEPAICNDFVASLNTPINYDTLPGYPIYLDDRASFSVSTLSGNPGLYNFISNTFSPSITLSSCDPRLNNGTKYCQVQNKITTENPTSVTWSHNYQNCKAPGIDCSPICTITKVFKIYPYPGYLKTDKGDSYLKGLNFTKSTDQIKYPITQFSKFSFGSGKALALHTPNGVQYFSSKQYNLLSYDDANNYYDYNWLNNKLSTDPRLSSNTLELGTSTFDQASFNNLKTNDTKLVKITGNLIINSGVICKSPVIFIIAGNLDINPNFSIENDNACLFIVRDKTYIKKINANDTVNAFIITGDYYSDIGDGTLTITGGLINNNTDIAQTYYKRNKNLLVVNYLNIDKTNPSELLNYEGARYIYHFGMYLQDPSSLSVREIQYTGGN